MAEPAWPFPSKNIARDGRRTDQGWDLQYPGTDTVAVYAVESGAVSIAGPDPNGFGVAYPLLTLDSAVMGFPSIYYGHVFPLSGIAGKHVSKGEPIAMTGGLHSGGNAYSLSNWLEIGFWVTGPVGNGAVMKQWLSTGKVVPGGSSFNPIPAPEETSRNDWSPHIRRRAGVDTRTANTLGRFARVLKDM